jgi:pyruvate/2-oxoglutarate dehydrogenase complex dihydrolipoamide dehydrogenase (E3) component
LAPQEYDAIVIGTGQAGGPLSSALARSGRHTAIIEREHIGGTCINEGCTPTKTMVASARVAYLARRGPEYGVRTQGIAIDMPTVRQRKRDIVQSFREGSESRLRETPGLDLLMGDARFVAPKTIEVRLLDGGTQLLHADLIFINTGARPAVPDLPGIASVPALNSTTIMELDSVPEHLIILGGSYIALEYGQMFRRFGSQVTLVERGPHLLSREDVDIAEAVEEILREDGVSVLLEAHAERVEPSGGGVALTVHMPDGSRTITGSHLLLAVGRTPNSDTLNLAATGLTTTPRGFIPANDRLESAVPGIYILGDVKGGPAFTHISYDDFRVARANVIEGKSVSIRDRLVPYTVFIDPQLGRVGMTEAAARREGRNIRVAKMPMSWVARALEVAEPRGVMKVVVDADTQQIVGAAVLGIEGGEIMAMLEIAMMGKVPYPTLRDGIFAHPTLAEALNNLFGLLGD